MVCHTHWVGMTSEDKTGKLFEMSGWMNRTPLKIYLDSPFLWLPYSSLILRTF